MYLAYKTLHITCHPQPPYPHKKFEGPTPIASRDMAHYIIGCKTLYVSNAKSMQTHKCLHNSQYAHLGVVVGGSSARHPPSTTTSNFDDKIFEVQKVKLKFRGGGGGGGSGASQIFDKKVVGSYY